MLRLLHRNKDLKSSLYLKIELRLLFKCSNTTFDHNSVASDWSLLGKAAKNVMSEQEAKPPPGQQTLTIQQAIDLGVEHHSAGRLPEAENVYQQILQAEPNQPAVLHMLGVIAHQVGKNDIAVDLIGKAIAIQPDFTSARH